MSLIVVLPLAFALFPSVLALPATAEPSRDVGFPAFPRTASPDDIDKLMHNDTLTGDDESDIEARHPAATQASQCTLATIEKIMFNYSMDDFQSASAAKSPSCFDWFSDKCTFSPDQPLGFDFVAPCQRHDFGDLNFAHMKLWTRANKERTDEQFREDLAEVCGGFRGWELAPKRLACQSAAKLYESSVKVFNQPTD